MMVKTLRGELVILGDKSRYSHLKFEYFPLKVNAYNTILECVLSSHRENDGRP